jgi:polynucleotide 5'-hydroxyl-kinase GRC3/NOL9
VLAEPGAVVVLGATDVGKTTTATALANAVLRAGCPAAVVDSDTGQSTLGPPTTVGLALPQRPARRMRGWPVAAAFFVGDTSPRGVYPFLLEGVRRCTDRARAWGAAVIVIDTTGWVEGPAAVAAKLEKLRLVAPRHVVALQRGREVEPILERLPSGVAVHRLRPSARVRRRSWQERKAAREAAFRCYFSGARRHVLPLARLPALRPARYGGRVIPQEQLLEAIPESALRHLLVGLADRGGWLRALGSVQEGEAGSPAVAVVAPLRSLAGVAGLQWGILRVAPDGTEQGRLE